MFSLKPAQLNFFLPGEGYTEEDLLRIQQESDSSTDLDLLQLAWEVSPCLVTTYHSGWGTHM